MEKIMTIGKEKFERLYFGNWEIDPHLKYLNEQLARARTRYYCVISAMPYMSQESKPYTRRTAQKYYDEIRELKKAIKKFEK